DRLGRLAQPHLVGEQGGVAGEQERDPFELVGNGSKGTPSCRPSNSPSSGGCSRVSSRSLNSTVSAVGTGRTRGFAGCPPGWSGRGGGSTTGRFSAGGFGGREVASSSGGGAGN